MLFHAFTATRRTRSAGLAALALSLACLAPIVEAQAAPLPPLTSVPTVDLTRYQGRWYQIAFYPNSFQRQCVANTTADYALLPDGTVEVTNQCLQADGALSKVVGQARIQKPKANLFKPKPLPPSSARLEVRFAPQWLAWIPAVWAPYWVIQLAEDYRYAVVSEPSRKYLWILSRTPTLDAQDDAIIRGLLQQAGYDTTKLRPEPQGVVPAAAPAAVPTATAP